MAKKKLVPEGGKETTPKAPKKKVARKKAAVEQSVVEGTERTGEQLESVLGASLDVGPTSTLVSGSDKESEAVRHAVAALVGTEKATDTRSAFVSAPTLIVNVYPHGGPQNGTNTAPTPEALPVKTTRKRKPSKPKAVVKETVAAQEGSAGTGENIGPKTGAVKEPLSEKPAVDRTKEPVTVDQALDVPADPIAVLNPAAALEQTRPASPEALPIPIYLGSETISEGPATGTDASHPVEEVTAAMPPTGTDALHPTPEAPASPTVPPSGSDGGAGGVDSDEHPAEGGETPEWRTIVGNNYFSKELQETAKRFHDHNDAALVAQLQREVEDNDGEAMRKLLLEFRICQNAVADFAKTPNDETFEGLCTAIDRFSPVVHAYASSAPALRSRQRPHADTDLERTTLSERIQFLAEELRQMTKVLPHGRASVPLAPFVVRPSLAQTSTVPLLGMSRQRRIRAQMDRLQSLLGPDGISDRTGFAEGVRSGIETVNRQTTHEVVGSIGNWTRNRFRRVLLVGGLVLSITIPGYMYVKSKLDKNVAVAQDKELEKQQALIDQVFAGMTVRVENGKLKVRFANMESLKLHESLFVCMGTGSDMKPIRMDEEGGEFVRTLAPAEAVPGTELSVSFRGDVGGNKWLYPKDKADPAFRTVDVQ